MVRGEVRVVPMPLYAIITFSMMLAGTAFAQSADVPLSQRDLEIRTRYLDSLEENPYQVHAFDRAYQSFQDNEGVAAWVAEMDDDGDKTAAHVLLGRIYARRLETAKAVTHLERARELGATGTRLDALLGHVYADAGRYRDAAPLLDAAAKALRDEDARADAIRRLGDVHNRLGNRDAAIAAWKRLAEGAHDDAFARWDLAGIYEDYRLWDEAAKVYANIATRSQADPYARCRALRAQAVAHMQIDEVSRAIALFEEALGLASPGNWLFNDLTQQLIAAYEGQGDLEELSNYVRARVEEAPASVEYRALLADVYARLDDVDRAEAEYRALLERAPDHVAAYLSLVRLFVESDRRDDAAAVFGELIGRYPHDTDYVRQLGELYWNAGAETQAVSAWRRVLESAETPERHAELAGWLASHDLVEDAIAEYELALASKHDRSWQFDLAELHAANGDHDAARAIWNATLTDESTTTEITEVGRLFEAVDFMADAEALYARAIGVDSENHESRHALALLLARTERFEESLPHFERLAAAEDSDYWRARGERGLLNAFNSLGILGKKQQEWEEAVEQKPDSIAHKLRLARLYESRGNHLGAVEVYRACTEQAPEEFAHREALANAYNRAGRYTQAAETYRALLEDQPSRARGYLRELLGVYRRLNNRDEAAAAAERVVELAPADAQARVQLAQVYLSHGRVDDAFSQFRHAIRLEPDQMSLHLMYGESLADHRRFVEARDAFRRLLDETEDRSVRADCLRRLGSIHVQLNSLDELTREHESHIRATPSRLDAYAELATIYSGAEQPDDALATLERAHGRVTNREDVLHLLLNAAFDANDLSKTIAYTEELISLSGKPDVYELVRLGRAYADLGDIETALSTWARIGKEYPDDARAIAAESDALFDHGYIDEAFDRTRAALDVDPFDSNMRAEFAQRLAEHGEFDEAFEQFFLALEYGEPKAQKPKPVLNNRKRGNIGFRDRIVKQMVTLARPFGQADGVVERLERARADNPDSQTARNDLMAAYEALQRTDEMITLAAEALETQPEDTALMQKLADLYTRSKQYDQAADLYLQLAELEPSRKKDIHLRVVGLYRQSEEHTDKALALMESTHEAMPDDFQVAMQLASLYGTADDTEAAEALYASLLDADSRYWQPGAISPQFTSNPSRFAAIKMSVMQSWAGFLEANDRLDEARRAYEDMIIRTDGAGAPAQPQANVYRVTGHGSQLGHLNDLRNAIQRIFPSVGYTRAQAVNQLVEMGMETQSIVEKLRERLPDDGENTDRVRNALDKILVASHAMNGDDDAALRLINTSLSQQPQDLELYNASLYIHERRFDYPAVLETYDRIRAEFPNTARHVDQAEISVATQEGDFARAIGILEAQLANGAQASSIVGQLQQLYYLGGRTEAAPLLDTIIARDPDSVEALALAARIRTDQGDIDAAIELAEKAWARSRGASGNAGMQVLQTLNSLYSRSGRSEELLESLRKTVESRPRSLQDRKLLAEVYNWNGKRDEAIKQYEAILEMRPRDTQMMRTLAERYTQAGRDEKAIELYSKMLTAQPGLYRQMGHQLSQLYQRTGQREKLAALEERIVQRSTSANDIVMLAQRALQRNDNERAITFFKRALAVEPENIHAQSEMARAYIGENDYEGAREALDSMINSARINHGQNLQQNAVRLMAAVYGKLDALHELTAVAESFGELQNGAAAKALILASVARREERYEDAVQLLKDATPNPADHRFVQTIVEIAKESKHPEWAIDTLREAADAQPYSNFWDQLAQLYFEQGNHKDAVEALTRQAKTSPYPHHFSNAIRWMMRHRMYDDAEAFYAEHRRILRRPQLAQSIDREVVQAYMKEGVFEDVVKNDILTPKNGQLESLLQTLSGSRHESGKRALELLQSASELFPDNVSFIRGQARMYMNLDRHKEAIPLWARVAEMQPNSANDRNQYAQALQRDNRRGEAAAMMAEWAEARPSLSRIQMLVRYLDPKKNVAAYRDTRNRVMARIDADNRDAARALFAPLDAQAGDAQAASLSLRERYELHRDGDSFRAYFAHEYDYGSLEEATALLADFMESDSFSAVQMPVNQAMTAGFRTGNAKRCDELLTRIITTLNDHNLSNALREAADVYERYGAYWRFDALLQEHAKSTRPAFIRTFEEMKARRGDTVELNDSALQRIADLDASNPTNGLAQILQQIKDKKAFTALVEDESVLPKNLVARLWILAYAHHHIGNTAERDEALDRLLENPDDWSRISTAITLLREFGLHERIVSFLEGNAKGDENIQRMRADWLSPAYVALGRFDDAVEIWATTRDRSGASLGRQLIQAKAYQQAVQVLEQEVAREPHRAWTYQHLADAAFLAGDVSGHRGTFRAAMENMANDNERNSLIDVYASFLQRHELAAGAIESGDVLQDDVLAEAILKCFANSVFDQLPESRQGLLVLMPELETDNPNVMTGVGQRLVRWEAMDEAARWFKMATEHSNLPYVQHQAVTGLAQCGKFDDAFAVLNEGENIDVNGYLDDSRLIGFLAKSPNREEAETYMNMFYEACETESARLYAEVIWLDAIGEGDAALERIEQLADVSDLPSRWSAGMANRLRSAGRCDAALRLTERMITGSYARGERDNARRQAIALAACAGDFGKAFEYFAEALLADPYNAGQLRKEFLEFANANNVQELATAAADFITGSPAHPSVVEIIHLFSELAETGLDSDAQSLRAIESIPGEILAALDARLNIIETWRLEAHKGDDPNRAVNAADLTGKYKEAIEPFRITGDADLPGALIVEQLGDHGQQFGWAGCLVARTEVESASTKSATVSFGSCHQAASVWVNGEPVFKQERHRGFNFDQNRFDVVLEQGTNEIVIQLYGPGNQGAFAFGFLEDGSTN